MKRSTHHSTIAALASAAVLALALAGCGTSSDDGTDKGGGEASADCSLYTEYGKHEGKTVSIYSSIRDLEAENLEKSWADFETCTGIKIKHEGASDFEAQLNVRVDGGNAPDIAFMPQPGLLARFAANGTIVAAPEAVSKNVDEGWSEDWKNYGSVDGEFYAAPLMASAKSFVWCSPSMFEESGYEVPKTWDDLMSLTQKIADDGVTPWCAGFASGDATGWVGTDWLEDVVLRSAGPDVYNQWVEHKIPFNDPQIVKALDEVGAILKDGKFVNGGIGDVKSIVTTDFKEAGWPIVDGDCAMHRQASFYGGMWDEGVTIGEDGDVFAFYLPAMKDDDVAPVLGGGEFVSAFNDKAEVQAVQTYLSSGLWANNRVKLGGVISANKGLQMSNVQDPISKLAVGLLQDPKTVFRFDGSDLMPAAVGTGSFWKAMVDWTTGASSEEVLTGIETGWPTS